MGPWNVIRTKRQRVLRAPASVRGLKHTLEVCGGIHSPSTPGKLQRRQDSLGTHLKAVTLSPGTLAKKGEKFTVGQDVLPSGKSKM